VLPQNIRYVQQLDITNNTSHTASVARFCSLIQVKKQQVVDNYAEVVKSTTKKCKYHPENNHHEYAIGKCNG